MIYHITTQQDWNARKDDPHFLPVDFEREGFIHCSMSTQVAGVLERYFKGQTGLVLLHLDETKLTSELKYEIIYRKRKVSTPLRADQQRSNYEGGNFVRKSLFPYL